MFELPSRHLRLIGPLVLLFVLATGLTVQAQTEEPSPDALSAGVLTRQADATAQVFSLSGAAGEIVRLTAT